MIYTMSAELAIQYAFEVLEFPKIVASTDTANLASIRVMEKTGMHFRQREVVDGLDTVFYELQQEDW